MAFSASSDLITMTIPNRVCAALVLGYLFLAAAVGLPLATVAIDLSCGLAVLALTFTLFSLGWIGGGDAKLAAATALWLGWALMLDYGLIASVMGGVLTIALILSRKAPVAFLGGAPGLGRPPASSQNRRSLWHRARRRRPRPLSADAYLARGGGSAITNDSVDAVLYFRQFRPFRAGNRADQKH